MTELLSLEEGQYLGKNRRSLHYDKLNFIDTTYHEKVFNGWHMHERAHLTLVLNGGNREIRKNSDRALITGQVVFYHSGEVHRNDHTIVPSRNLNLEIDPGFFADYQLTEQQIDTAIRNGQLSSLEIMSLFNEVLFQEDTSTAGVHLLLLGAVTEVAKRNIPDWLLRLRDLLNDRWDSWPSLCDLAAEADVHPVTISKYFHRFFECTLGVYMRKLKAQHAFTMIRSGNHSLSEIAHACGFADQSHFSRCFKATTGMLPKYFEGI
ncbi:helix-turn-helix transcriptional regulator [Pedobacter sp. SYP-B3415]|uniref:helix-turn-helix transcriptional regulator n=1 Tax=Pedobacter sp. SYP-B3415 TaxID=2496641 RepID=UPI00101D7DAB|nr:helix-turn-helix transcriptional regulator [Pedobacter sp. SYP-B3415]